MATNDELIEAIERLAATMGSLMVRMEDLKDKLEEATARTAEVHYHYTYPAGYNNSPTVYPYWGNVGGGLQV